ncbi:MAG: PIN domain-containing protein [Candidatus Hydrogenedentota bacterium]
MKALLDLNVWIDMAIRPVAQSDSIRVFELLRDLRHQICFPLCGYTTVYYLLRRDASAEMALTYMNSILDSGTTALAFDESDARTALRLPFSDQEDASVAATALNHEVDVIVTRDVKGFHRSPVRAASVEAMLRELAVQ